MTIRTILLTVDFEPAHAHAIDYAFELAEKLGATVHALHAYPPVVVPNAYGSGSIPYQALHEQARSKLRCALGAHLDSRAMGKCVVDLGEPLTVILEMAAALSADLIVVGTHGRQGLQRLLAGSVAESVLRETSLPVLVVGAATAPGRAKPLPPPGTKADAAAPRVAGGGPP